MEMSKIIGYCRVSSKGQIDNNSLEQQKREILHRYENAVIHQEQYTGTKMDRPIFNSIINDLQPGDTLVVTKLDRLARTTEEGIRTVKELFERGVIVHVLQIGLLENNTIGKLFITILLAIAEMERNTIIERTALGREIARTKEGYKEGRPEKYNPEYINHALNLLETHSFTQVAHMTGISKSTLQRAKKKRDSII